MGDDPDILVPLTEARSEFEAETIAESLRSQGIPAQVFSMAARVGQWEFGVNNAVKVMVRRADERRAADALRALRADSVDIDWSEVDVGAATPDHAPQEPETARGRERADRRRQIAVVIVILGLLILALALIPAAIPNIRDALGLGHP